MLKIFYLVVISVLEEGGERFQSYQPHLAPVVIAFYLIFLQICVLCSPVVVSQYQKSGDVTP